MPKEKDEKPIDESQEKVIANERVQNRYYTEKQHRGDNLSKKEFTEPVKDTIKPPPTED